MKSRHRLNRLLGRAGLYFSVLVLISPADSILPVDAVIGFQERGGQHRLSAGVHPQSRQPGTTSSTSSPRMTS